MTTPSNKKKKMVPCTSCLAKDQEIQRDDDGDWNGSCAECGCNLGRIYTRREVNEGVAFKPEPEKKPKKGWLD